MQQAYSIKRAPRESLFEKRDRLIPLKDLAQDVGRSVKTLRHWQADGMPVEKVMGRVMVDPQAVWDWMERKSL